MDVIQEGTGTGEKGNGESERRDLQLVDAAAWPRREFPATVPSRTSVVPVVIKQSILNHIHRHGQQTTDVEICGVLVGRGYRDDDGPFVYVEGAIRGDHAESQTAQVTFTSETWNHIYAILDTAWPEQRILAWYHTHPGFGIFLSGMDLFIHDNFFNAPEQFALVYDPLSGDEGIFLWSAGQATRASFLIEPDEAEDPPQRPSGRLTAAGHDSSYTTSELADEVRLLRKRQTWLTVLLSLLVALLLFQSVVTVFGGLMMLNALEEIASRQKKIQPPNEDLMWQGGGIRTRPGHARIKPSSSDNDDLFAPQPRETDKPAEPTPEAVEQPPDESESETKPEPPTDPPSEPVDKPAEPADE